jgi:hypothetical protein
MLPVDEAERLVAYVAVCDGRVNPHRPLQPLEGVNPLKEIWNRLVALAIRCPELLRILHIQRKLDLYLAGLELVVVEEKADTVVVLLDGEKSVLAVAEHDQLENRLVLPWVGWILHVNSGFTFIFEHL